MKNNIVWIFVVLLVASCSQKTIAIADNDNESERFEHRENVYFYSNSLDNYEGHYSNEKLSIDIEIRKRFLTDTIRSIYMDILEVSLTDRNTSSSFGPFYGYPTQNELMIRDLYYHLHLKLEENSLVISKSGTESFMELDLSKSRIDWVPVKDTLIRMNNF